MRANPALSEMGCWLGRSCVGVAFVLVGCGGATESSGNLGADSGVQKGADAGFAFDGTRSADSRSSKDVTTTIDVSITNDVGTGPKPDAIAMPDTTGISLPDVVTTIDAGSPSFDAGHFDAGAGCPSTTPMAFSMCMMAGETCTYGATVCDCGGAMRWNCHTCPATEPAAGSACQGGGFGGGGVCAYGSADCSCVGGQWSCGSCPAAEPMNAGACTVAGQSCGYDAGTCQCRGGGPGGMMGDTWRCQSPCPTAQPAPGAMCNTGPAQQCVYGTTTCLCTNGTYFCN